MTETLSLELKRPLEKTFYFVIIFFIVDPKLNIFSDINIKVSYTFYIYASSGRCTVRRHICWHEIGWCHINRCWLFPSYVPRKLARLHNTLAKVRPNFN